MPGTGKRSGQKAGSRSARAREGVKMSEVSIGMMEPRHRMVAVVAQPGDILRNTELSALEGILRCLTYFERWSRWSRQRCFDKNGLVGKQEAGRRGREPARNFRDIQSGKRWLLLNPKQGRFQRQKPVCLSLKSRIKSRMARPG